MTAVTVIIIVLYVVVNLITAHLWSAREMKQDFVDGQCLVGRIFANLFYAPAWVMKFVRALILITIK